MDFSSICSSGAEADFSDADTYDARFTAIINDSLARQAFGGRDPIGRTIFCGFDSLTPMRIVRVVGDTRQYGPAKDPMPEIYLAYQQHPRAATAMSVLVRTAAGPASLFATMRRKACELARLSENVAAPRFRMLLLGVFAGLAVCLAMAGVSGVMSDVVGQRSNEIGLRVALGATPGDVVRLVLRQGLALAAIR